MTYRKLMHWTLEVMRCNGRDVAVCLLLFSRFEEGIQPDRRIGRQTDRLSFTRNHIEHTVERQTDIQNEGFTVGPTQNHAGPGWDVKSYILALRTTLDTYKPQSQRNSTARYQHSLSLHPSFQENQFPPANAHASIKFSS